MESHFRGLPEEILFDIFSRLPVKSLLVLKSVCKKWRHLISTPYFIKLHLHHPFRRRSLAVFLSRRPPASVAFRCIDTETHSDQSVIELCNNFKYSYPNARIWNSCDGLILFSISDKTFFAWNPSTRDQELVRHVPPCSPLITRTYFLLLGLGYDRLVDEYKVVGAVDYGDRGDDSFVFCSSLPSSNNSRLINNYFPYTISKDSPGTVVNGVLYWMVNRYSVDGERSSPVIIYFDFAAEMFVEMAQPTYGFESDIYEYGLGVLRGSLCVVCNRIYQVEVLGLEMCGEMESWARLFVINNGEGLNFRVLKPYCFTEKGEVIMGIDRRRLVVYNLEERTHGLLFFHPEFRQIWRIQPVVNPDGFEVVLYVESLVSPRTASKGYGAIANRSSTGWFSDDMAHSYVEQRLT